jgi:ribosomal protein S18 acetylase RimI-like enzyme
MGSDSFVIRPPKRDEIPLLVEMQVAMAVETEPFRLDPRTVLKGITAVFEDPSKGQYWVAENSQHEILGMLLTVPEWSDWRNATVLWIHSVYVVPQARRLGVYRALYQHLKMKVESSEDYRGLRLYVEKQNSRAQKVYESLGMSQDHYHLYEWMKGF